MLPNACPKPRPTVKAPKGLAKVNKARKKLDDKGCHAFSHRDPAGFRARFPDWNPRKAARATQRTWLKFLAGESVGLPSTER